MKYSIWYTAEEIADEGGVWLVDGPWADAEHEDTIDDALEHLQTCCEALVEYRDGDDGDYDGVEWLALKEDKWLLNHLLEQLEATHRWYDDIKQLYFLSRLSMG
jgi:hypothetical protein